MRRFIKRLTHWFFRLRGERLLILEVAVLLLINHLAIHTLPFRYLSRWLGKFMEESPSEGTAPHQVRRVGYWIRRVAEAVPWKPKCLAQAITGQMMLARRGYHSTLYLGVHNGEEDGSKKLKAHAWLRHGASIVTGRSGMEKNKVISYFAKEV